ncbi:MAG: hypothetical protein ACKVXR_07385 [Planctomycetota bacterium]
MDLNAFWQENKRSVVATAGGIVVFVVGSMLVDRYFRDELRAQTRAADSAAAKLRAEPMFGASDRDKAEKENEGLTAAVSVLSEATAFEARPAFQLDPKAGAPTNQYFAAVSRVRDELLTLAGRNNLRLPDDLGLPALSPTREEEIARYLEALDLVDRVARTAMAAGVQRIDKVEIRLDPKLATRQGVGELERTRVEITAAGAPAPLVRFLSATQAASSDPAGGWKPLILEKADVLTSRGKADEATLQATFLVARLQGGS